MLVLVREIEVCFAVAEAKDVESVVNCDEDYRFGERYRLGY